MGCNIVDSSQFDDLATARFFMRVSFISEQGATGSRSKPVLSDCQELHHATGLYNAADRVKVLLMVSRFGHCLNDLLYRWKIGALPIDIVGVVSNHFEYQKVVVNHDIPFHHIKVTKENKAKAEAQLMDVVVQTGTEWSCWPAICRYCRTISARRCRAGSSTSTTPSCQASRVQTPTSRPMSAA